MRTLIVAAVLCFTVSATAQDTKAPVNLKSILLQQLHEVHNQKNWFVSEKEAAMGLTPEQAAWSDGKNHSVGQLVQHLTYWNRMTLVALQGHPEKAVDDNNETFNFDPKTWDATQKQFDQVMTDLETLVQSADDATLAKIAPTIARVAQHNAYHIGEMVTSRKKQGSWDPEKGVK
ncbi:MAG TPA: DinB family protein [Terriglobales bacterium]|nr:DinB family protein [Terriglobales bacterium]